jgi:hypothetical protein
MDKAFQNKKVLLFLPQGFEDIEVTAFTDILGWTRVLKGLQKTRPLQAQSDNQNTQTV